MERIPASERTREKLKAVIEGTEKGAGASELVRLAARLIIEEALEGEARDVLGREYYARGAAPGAGYRNGYRTGRLDSAEGRIEYSAPQIADRATPFRSAIRELVRGRTAELEALAVEMYARGLSTRDIEALFADAEGKSLLSRTAVSEITARLWAEYEGFVSRDLAEFEIVYLFVDGIAERLHLGQPREAVLAAWGLLAARRRCCTWRRAPRRTRPAAASSFTTCVGAACPIRCWWSATARPASSARSKNASRARCGNAVWRTRCAIWQAKCPKTSGLSSRPVPPLAIRPPRRLWRDCCATTSGRPMAAICRAQ